MQNDLCETLVSSLAYCAEIFMIGSLLGVYSLNCLCVDGAFNLLFFFIYNTKGTCKVISRITKIFSRNDKPLFYQEKEHKKQYNQQKKQNLKKIMNILFFF